MHAWYCAGADGQRHGPFAPGELRARIDAGSLGPDTLAWREGWDQWRPLGEAAAELPPSAPPPLPAASPAAAARPPRSGLPGYAIAVLVLGAGGLLLVMVLGILAAIALPAYQQYTLRAHAAAAMAQVRSLQVQVAEFAAAHARCPRNGEEDFGQPADYASGALGAVYVGPSVAGLCGLEATIAAPGRPALDGTTIRFEYHAESGSWTCSSDADGRYLPADCRG